MRFLFIGSRFTLHASFPRSVALTQLRFALLTVTSSQRDLHPQVCAHAGRTTKTGPKGPVVFCQAADYFKALKRTRLGLAPSSPRRFFLSASYSW